jgi:predicted GTPase
LLTLTLITLEAGFGEWHHDRPGTAIKRSAIGRLELDRTDSPWRDVDVVCQQVERSSFRIAVFGSFNYGKSTLLNALLGERMLPIDRIA